MVAYIPELVAAAQEQSHLTGEGAKTHRPKNDSGGQLFPDKGPDGRRLLRPGVRSVFPETADAEQTM